MRLLSVFAPCLLTGAFLMAQGQPTPAGPIQVRSNQAKSTQATSLQDRNKAVAMRVFDEIFNQGKFQVADEIYAPDFQNHGATRTVDLKVDQEYVHAEKKAFPDLRISVQQMVAEGDKVVVLWTFRGTHTGSGYEGLPPTGTKVEVRGMTIWRIVEEWSSFSETGGLHPNACPSEVVVGVCGVGPPDHSDRCRTSC
ncbi:MAG TPA: ester cyclase, partial [Terriglobales bacterium]|nr:ester cyclase [Terriglobales bacterium]